MANLLTFLKKPLEADQSWGRLLSIRQELSKAFPESLEKHADLAAVHSQFADRYQKAGKDQEAVSHWKDTAAELGQCMILADKDTTRDTKTRAALVKECGDKAMAALLQAVSLGFREANYLKTAPEFRLLRERPEFQKLFNRMEAKDGGKIPRGE